MAPTWLRADLEARGVGYVLAIGCDRRMPTAAGPMRADTLAAQAGHHWLLIRRHPRHGELAFYRCYSPTPVPLGELVRVAGRRWTTRPRHFRRQEAQLT